MCPLLRSALRRAPLFFKCALFQSVFSFLPHRSYEPIDFFSKVDISKFPGPTGFSSFIQLLGLRLLFLAGRLEQGKQTQAVVVLILLLLPPFVCCSFLPTCPSFLASPGCTDFSLLTPLCAAYDAYVRFTTMAHKRSTY